MALIKKNKPHYMCRPCAEALKADGKVTIGTSHRDKETCECCNRRRYVYEVEYNGD